MITAYFNQLDLAKYCGLTSDDMWEASQYEYVTDPQYTQVTWLGERPD